MTIKPIDESAESCIMLKASETKALKTKARGGVASDIVTFPCVFCGHPADLHSLNFPYCSVACSVQAEGDV